MLHSGSLPLLGILASCASSPDQGLPPPVRTATAQAPAPSPQVGEAVGYFAGGCFWGVEHFLERLDGVIDVDSGYMGGTSEAPNYAQVSTGTSGHVETVRVRFDANKITYRAIAKRFFEIHDPTQADGQGPDIGSQYHSAVFYVDDSQRQVAQELIGQLEARGYAVVTTLREAQTFWPAEAYHQDYYTKTGKKPYCHAPVARFGD